jgi:RNA recognition motif-containing protein
MMYQNLNHSRPPIPAQSRIDNLTAENATTGGITAAGGFNPAMLRNDYIDPFDQYHHPQHPQNHQQLSNVFVTDEMPLVAEPERCTVRCTGVPTKVEEHELLAHFKTFGKVIGIRKIPAAPATEDKKTYNEFFIQYFQHNDAQKCINSPKSVLDNRFIRLHMSNFNLIQLADVPTYLEEGRDADINGVRSATEECERGDSSDKPTTDRRTNPVKEKAAAALKQKYEDLMQLRHSQEEIYKKKEQLLQVLLLLVKLQL